MTSPSLPSSPPAPGSAEALVAAVPALLAQHGRVAVLQQLIQGVVQHPLHAGVRQALAEQLDGVGLGAVSPTVREVLTTLIDDPAVSAQPLAGAALGPVMAGAPYQALMAAVRGAAPLPAEALAAFSQDPLVVAALPRLVGFHPELEAVLAAVRRTLLELALPDGGVPPAGPSDLPTALPFLAALAGHAWAGEYPWEETSADGARLDALERWLGERVSAFRPWSMPAVSRAHAVPESVPESVPEAVERALALLAAWRPLDALPWASALADVSEAAWSAPLRALCRTQLHEPLEEARRARAMPACTPLANAMSQAVRAMYEANPYPRWLTLRPPAPHHLGAFIRHWRPELPCDPEATRLLVAGCGSGQQVLQLALAFPEAEVVAFDLSRRSLGYAARMAERYGAAHVRFAQGDLLAFEADTPFHLVSCSGVLHHLADPLAGWRGLRVVLHPDGIMKVGLYSTLARRGIVAAQRHVVALGHGTDAAGLRRSRHALLVLPEGHPARAVFGFVDAYSLSGFRDLVCHVQERSYTVAELQEALAAVRMRFLGFQLPAPVMAAFTARHGASARGDLAAWEAFEEAHPDTFAAMYQFWCAPA
jgi:SAM-dependent methyltransferase